MEITSPEPVLQSGELIVFGFIVELNWIVTTLISTCALLFAGWSVWISHRAVKLVQESVEPIISAVLAEIPELSDWLVIRIGLTNRAGYTLEAETLSVVRPSGALLLEHSDAHVDS